MSTYWPWWAGAIGLALVTVNYTLITDRSFGVSSAWDRVLHWRRERDLEEMDEEFADDRALAEALAAATAEHFGTGTSTQPQVPYGNSQTLEADTEPAASESPAATSLRPAPLVTQAALLISIFLGGLIAAVTSGRFHLR
ncbi:transporter, partial [Streptomyces sp. NPDC057486]